MKLKIIIFSILLLQLFTTGCNTRPVTKEGTEQTETQSVNLPSRVGKPPYVRGIHLSAWVAGSTKLRQRFDPYLSREKLNTIVIAIKEFQGEVYIPGVKVVEKYGTPCIPIPKLEEYLNELKFKGVYPIARIVVFKDTALAKLKPELAVKTPDGSVWKDYKGYSWTDPYNKEVWRYNIEIAKRAAELGFEEIQFDYIRFPSDGNTRLCRYSQHHTSTAATRALVEFLILAKKELEKYSVPISIDVFGLTPSVNHDMGIGQRFLAMAEVVDYVSPMMYPSHYAKYEYGIPDPNREPYRTVFRTVKDAKNLLKEQYHKLRPYLQDFSLGYKYGPQEIKAQIFACYDNGIFDWLLWDPKCKYHLEVIEEMSKYTPENYKIKISTQ